MLLEAGEKNAAVLLARSPLPDEIDTEHEALVSFGLERDQLDEIAPLTIGAIEPDDVNTRRRRGELEKTISRRWPPTSSTIGRRRRGVGGPRPDANRRQE